MAALLKGYCTVLMAHWPMIGHACLLYRSIDRPPCRDQIDMILITNSHKMNIHKQAMKYINISLYIYLYISFIIFKRGTFPRPGQQKLGLFQEKGRYDPLKGV